MAKIKLKFSFLDFSELDREIMKIRDLRDSYHAANVIYYGEQLAAMLNE